MTRAFPAFSALPELGDGAGFDFFVYEVTGSGGAILCSGFLEVCAATRFREVRFEDIDPGYFICFRVFDVDEVPVVVWDAGMGRVRRGLGGHDDFDVVVYPKDVVV